MDLSRDQYFASIVGVPSQEVPALMRVHPGRPDSSYLIKKLKGEEGIVGAQMPLVGDRLTPEELGDIEAWIRALGEADESGEPMSGDSGGPYARGTAYAFDGWRVVNLPTTRALDAGSWLFQIRHRFNPPITSGYGSFYGLDGSGIILLGLGYAFTDRLLVTLARSNSADEVELQGRYLIARQRHPNGFPVDIGVLGTTNWITEKPPGKSLFREEAFKVALQLTFAREFGTTLGMSLVPGILFNPAEGISGESPTVTLGLAGQWRFYRSLSLVAEWVPILSGYTRTSTFGNDSRFDSWGGGLQITTGGHVFQIVVSNAVGLTADQYLRGGDLDIRAGDMRLGFNIFRILNF